MAFGPLEYMVLGCTGTQFMNEIVPELSTLQERSVYQQMLIDMNGEDFCGIWHFTTFWGTKS